MSCEHLGEGIEEGDFLEVGRQVADRIDDRRGVEEQLEEELPDLPDVAKADEERRKDERHAEGEEVELEPRAG